MNVPQIKFVELQDKTEKGLIAYLMEHRTDGHFLVYLRKRYTENDEWEYSVEACNLFNYCDVGWLVDWYEGEPFVEYLAITAIDA